MPPHPLIGKELGNWVVRALIGEGGMGVVFSGEHRFLGTRCAVKVLHGTYANNPTVTQRFFQEAKATIAIEHPNVIKILDMGQSNDGALYLVMELLEGRSLGHAIAEGTFGEGAVARIGSLVAEGLAAAHQKGIVHRDLKPDNIFLTGEQLKVLDFGIAKVMQSTSSTKTGSLLGTPQYMAPEQAKGSKHVGPHTDVYALGAILFEMLAGRPPFIGEDLPELLAQQLFEPPPSPRQFANCSTEMETIILQCLEKDPKARPASMVELRDRLKLRIGVATSASRPISPTISPEQAVRVTPTEGRVPTPREGRVPTPQQPIAAQRVPTPAHGTSLPERTPTPPEAAPSLPRPYVPTFTPSTIADAASEVIGDATESHQLIGGGRRIWFAAAVVVMVAAIGIGVVATRKPAGAPSPAPAPVVAAAPVAKPVEPRPAAATNTPAAPRIEPAPQAAKVVVRSEPNGATVSIEGRSVGTTPALLTLSLPQEITVSLKGYRPAREVLSSPGETIVRLAAEARAKPAATAAKPTKKPTTVEKPAPSTPQPPARNFREGLD